MATLTESIDTTGYSSTARKVLLLGADGTTYATVANPIPTTATVTVNTMNLYADMQEASGHDYYTTTTNVGDGISKITFDAVAGLTLSAIQLVENKTKGYVYVTAGATVATTSITLDMTKQITGAPLPGAADEFEIVYRGTSRLTDKSQFVKITDGTNTLGTASYPLVVTLGSGTGSANEVLRQLASGTDAYQNVGAVTAKICDHISISLEGSYPAIISLNGGTTDHIWVNPGSVVTQDDCYIASGAQIQAKNGDAGSNHGRINIMVW